MFITISSEYIKSYINQNPIIRVNKPERLSRTPTLAMGEFYNLLQDTGQLFNQEQYFQYLIRIWKDFYQSLTDENRLNLKRRVYRNFYLSGIDQLYVQSLLAESGMFSIVGYDYRLETTGIDILAITMTGKRLTIALQVDTRQANYSHRDRDGIIVIKKRLVGNRHGNMFWYQADDLEPVIAIARLDYLNHYRISSSDAA